MDSIHERFEDEEAGRMLLALLLLLYLVCCCCFAVGSAIYLGGGGAVLPLVNIITIATIFYHFRHFQCHHCHSGCVDRLVGDTGWGQIKQLTLPCEQHDVIACRKLPSLSLCPCAESLQRVG